MYKVCICQNEISAYSVPVYNIIAEKYDLTVAFYLKDKSNIKCNFKKIHLKSWSLGPFTFIKDLNKICRNFDIVCILPNLRIPSYSLMPFLPRRNKLVNWSIGFRASYTMPYIPERKHVLGDKLFQMILSHCDASIFYMEKAKEFWKTTNLDTGKIFIAPNTAAVLPIDCKEYNKRDFLFVGTLYKGKGLDTLLFSYKEAVDSHNITNSLHIIGDGPERKYLESYVHRNKLSHLVFFHGAIYDEVKLAHLFSKALLCISPTQAGLSVPKSMGYAVPFITRKDAITGGEIYHITSGLNGITYENDKDLQKILVEASLNPMKYYNMGMRAKEYYDKNATIRHMADGAIKAFEYVMKL